MTLRDRAIAAVRTGAAALAAGLIGWLLTQGVDLPDIVDQQIPIWFFAVGAAGYDFVANWLATHVKWLGFLLLVPKQPAYDPAKPVLVPDSPPALRDEQGMSALEALVGVVVLCVIVLLVVLIAQKI